MKIIKNYSNRILNFIIIATISFGNVISIDNRVIANESIKKICVDSDFRMMTFEEGEKIAQERIKKAIKNKAVKLDLSELRLKKIPPEVFK